MADSKYYRILQTFPRTFKPIDGDALISNLSPTDTVGKTIAELWEENVPNPVLNAVLRGFAQADDEITTQLQNTKAQLFVRTAENQFLDVIASSLGVSRPGSLGLSDTAFQNLVPPLSLGAKQVRQSFYNAMDAFYGPEFSRANLITLNPSPFDLQFSISSANPQIQDTLQFAIDNNEAQSIVIRSDDVTISGSMTALELNNLLNKDLSSITSEVLVDPLTDEESVRIRTNTPGLRGSLTYVGIRRTTTTHTNIMITNNDTSNQILTVSNATGTFAAGDVITTGNGLNFTILNVSEISPNVTDLLLEESTIGLDLTITGADMIAIQVRNEELPIFSTEKAELLKQSQRTAVYEVSPNEVVIELPAVIPTLARGLKGALHIHNGPLLNLLINRGETTDVIIPDALFDDNTTNVYTVVSVPVGALPFTYDKTTRNLAITPIPGQELDVYELTVTNDSNPTEFFTFFVRVDDRLNPAANQDTWVGAFLFDPNGTETPFTVTGASAVITGDAITGDTTLAAGRVYPRVNVDAATNTLPTTSGLAVIGYGSESQESSLIRYRGRAADNIIELDPSFVFTNNQPAGTYINIVSSSTPFAPDRFGNAYPIYLTSSTEARVVVQSILQSLAAAGIVVTFVVLAPDYKYLIDNPYLTTDDAPVV